MATILYCEDDKDNRKVIDSALRNNFPQHSVISTETVRDGLEGVTGVSLHPRHMDRISLETVEQRLRSSNANLSELGMVITDGKLIDPFAGAGDEIIHGWDLAQILRNLGYKGKILYTGLSAVPVGKKDLFDAEISKYEGGKIVDYARMHLT